MGGRTPRADVITPFILRISRSINPNIQGYILLASEECSVKNEILLDLRNSSISEMKFELVYRNFYKVRSTESVDVI